MFGIFKKKEPRKSYKEEYNVWIILRKDSEHKLHDWTDWSICYRKLNKFIISEHEKMSIRTSQSSPSTSNWLPFGRMVWNEKNNVKWTSKYKQGEDKIDQLEFFDTEFWMPSWSLCDKLKTHPNLFMQVKLIENGMLEHFFDESFLIASTTNSIPSKVIEELAESLDAKYLIKGTRPWGSSFSESSYTDSLQDFMIYKILDKENTAELRFKSKKNLLGSWEIHKTYK